MVCRLLPGWLLVVASAFGVTSAQAAAGTADTVVAAVPAVRHLSAYRTVTAWSHAVGDPRAGVFRVAYRRGGVTRELPGRFSSPDVDPDLGPSRDGRSVVLVVSRCGRRGCAVQSTDTRSGRTVRVHGLGRLHCAGLISPSTWRGTVAVVGERCGRKAVDALYVRDRSGGVRRLMGLDQAASTETDVDGAHAVISQGSDASVSIVALRTGRSRVVWQGDFSASFEDAPSSPALDGGVLFWLETDGAVGRGPTQWLAAAPATVRPATACGRRRLSGAIEFVQAIAIADRRLVYASPDAVMRRAGTRAAPPNAWWRPTAIG